MNTTSNKQIFVLATLVIVAIAAITVIVLNSQNTQQNQGEISTSSTSVVSTNISTNTVSNTTSAENTETPDAPEATFTRAQLATHNRSSDCYIAYKGIVYNITSFVSQHPGGFAIVTACGTEVDLISQSHEGGSFDSPSVQAVLANSRIGKLQN